MDGSRAYSVVAMPPVKGNREENVRRLRSAISNEGIIRRTLKVGIVKVNIRKAVTGRREINHPSTCADQRRNPVHQNKVAKVISAKLGLEAIRRVTKRCRHHTGIGNDHVE